MEFLGIGPMELLLIILLAIIIFGPKDIVKAGKSLGKSLSQFIRSDTWKSINQTSQELKNLPNRLMREAGLDELEKTAREEQARADRSIHPPSPTLPTPDATPGGIKNTDASPRTDQAGQADQKDPD